MLIAILGRQAELSLAELEAKLGASSVKPVNNLAALLDVDTINLAHFGGTLKVAKLLARLKHTDLDGAFDYVAKTLPSHLSKLPDEGKLHFGVSIYGFSIKPKQQLQKLLQLKKIIRNEGRSVRIIENKKPALGSAQILYNKLTSKLGWELLIVGDGKDILLGKTLSVQDIDEYSRRDHGRPARDARVGMLPPKLAQIMINLATQKGSQGTVYDPFCGTGVVLQEAALMEFSVAGSDLEPRMIEYTGQNLNWLSTKIKPKFLQAGDATSFQVPEPINFIASEMFLGKPLNKPPDTKLLHNLLSENQQLLRKTLHNFANQIPSGSTICMAIPAWRQGKSFVSVLDDHETVDYLKELSYTFVSFNHVSANDLLYARPDQVVGRKLLVLRRN